MPIKFWLNVLVRKTKDNHTIPLENWDSHLNSLYDSLHTTGNILNTPIKEDIFSLEDIECGINKLANGECKDIEGYQDQIFKMGRSILIPHLYKLLNLVANHGFPTIWMQSLIVPILKNGEKSIPSNYMTIMISHILAKLYALILENKLSLWCEN